MRNKSQMFDLILNTARGDDRIRAVILNGSRANPDAPPDFFQDFLDIIYIVTEAAAFRRDPGWIQRFGELMILQMPDEMSNPPPGEHDPFAYLMQFSDGNRIDLTIYPLAQLGELKEDSLSLLLLDKDGVIPPFAPSSDRGYLPQPPTARQYADCCNEFWWVCPYVAKGLWRDELPYAKYMAELVRQQLMKMLTWYVGVKTGFARGPGKYGKYLRQHLEPELWALLEKTYSDAGAENTWQALYAMGDLFRIIALRVAEEPGFDYPLGDDRRVSAHLRHVHDLPRTAKEIYP